MRESNPESASRSPSAELLDAAREAERSREHPSDPRGRYERFQNRFQLERRMDALGLRQAVLELRSPSAIDPPRPATLRGLLGQWIVRAQARTLWWVVRALGLQSRAIEAAYETLQAEHRRLAAFEEKYAAETADFEKRLRNLEQHTGIEPREDEGD